MENGPGLKMYFLLIMGIFQPAILVLLEGKLENIFDFLRIQQENPATPRVLVSPTVPVNQIPK